MKNKTMRQLLSILMCFAVVFSMFPATFFAWDEDATCEFCSREIHDDWICDCGEHCSDQTDDDCYENHHCSECGQAAEELCDNCGRCESCEESVYCNVCNTCSGEELCPICEMCEDCMALYSCESCGNCDPTEWCDGCNYCNDCALDNGYHCIECEGCKEVCDMCYKCDDCALHCKECGGCEYDVDICSEECGLCYDCGGECSEGRDHACLECHDGASACDECGKCFGSDEHIDGVTRCMECGRCEDCMGNEYCRLCGACGDCRELCPNCGGDACVECHEEYGTDEMAPCPGCGYCKADGSAYCTECGVCEGCAEVCPDCNLCYDCGDGYHCPECNGCFELYGRCEMDGMHCTDCCESNDWLCPNCGECTEPKGDVGLCRDCGACSDCTDFCNTCGENDLCIECCVEVEGLHCPECYGCYEETGTGYCYNCMVCSDCVDYCDACDLCVECGVADGGHCEDCYACIVSEGYYCGECSEYICLDCVGWCDECEMCVPCAIEKDQHCAECEDCCNYFWNDPRYKGLCNDCDLCTECMGIENWCANCGMCNDCAVKDPYNAIYYWHCTGCKLCASLFDEPFCETCHQCENCCVCNNEYTVTVNYESGGIASADATTVKYNKPVVLTATAESGYQFSKWEVVSGDVTITDNTFTMPAGNVTVKAYFVPLVATHPEDVTVEEGQTAQFTASCKAATVNYYWQYAYKDTDVWFDATFATGYNTNSISFEATLAMNGYKYRCVVMDGQGDRTYSDYAVLTVTEKAVEQLPAPTVTLSNVASTGKIKISWNKVEGASKYEVYRSTSKNGTYTLLKTLTGTSLTNTSTTAGTTYYYKVRALHTNSAANSEYSTIVYRTCDLPAPTVTLSNVASTGKIKISWNKVEGASKYEVYRSTSKNGTYTLLKTLTGTSLTNTSTTAGTTYYYKVRAIHTTSAANSAYSEVEYRTCDLARPTVTLSNVASTGKIKISWNKVEGASKYEVYRSTSKDGTYTLLKTLTGTSLTNTSTTAGTTYYYKVRAIHTTSAANSANSAIVYRTCDLARPTVTLKLNTSGKPVISWNKVEGASKYEVYRSTSKDGTYTLLKTMTGTSLTNTSTTAGTTYYYKVRAIHTISAANSAYSEVKSIASK